MKGKRVDYHEGAVADVKSALVWYRERSPNAALDFIEELHRATNTIRESPDRWPSAQITPDGSCFGDSLFSVIYSEQESAITIWAVAHGSRRPEYWARRLK